MPNSGRCQVNLFDMASIVEERLASISAPIKVAVMGCVVNGPGELGKPIFIAGGKGPRYRIQKRGSFKNRTRI